LSIEGIKATGSETSQIFSDNPEFLILVPVLAFAFYFMWKTAKKFKQCLPAKDEKEKDDADLYENL